MVALKYNPAPGFLEAEEKILIVNPETKKLWAVLIDLLVEFKRVCEKHNIVWSIDGGTMLGARRHGGFIPWDDDVDVIMFREEYEKLKSVADDFKPPYFLQNNDTDPECVRGHAQFRNSATTAILRGEFDGRRAFYRYNQGVFLDIFVLDNIPDDNDERKAFFGKLRRMRNRMTSIRSCLYHRVQFFDFFSIKGIVTLVWHFWLRMKWCFIKEKIFWRIGNDFDVAARRYESCVTKCVSHITFQPYPDAKVIFERRMLDGIVEVDFEGIRVPCFKESDHYLSHIYGDWHKHIIGTALHGGLFIDLDKSYTEYLKK